MSVTYQAIGWNRAKKVYDGVLVSGLALYLGVFIGVGAIVHPNATLETLLIRGMGTAALTPIRSARRDPRQREGLESGIPWESNRAAGRN